MKRLHIHLSVKDLEKNKAFYSNIFGIEPSVVKDDYLKWEVDEPAVNFAISTREGKEGLNHLGIQTDSEEDLQLIGEKLEKAEYESVKQESADCCYSKSNKYWSMDPQGIPWECFQTLSAIPVFGESEALPFLEEDENIGSSCCVPRFNSDDSKSSCC